MNRIWISISALAAVCGSASFVSAADMPVKAAPPVVVAAYDWSGFYGGINGGGETQKHDWAFNPSIPGAVNQSFSERVDSATIGFHVGVQKQWNQFVLGVEGGVNDFAGAGFARHTGYGVDFGSFADTRVKDIYTAGGRVGYAWQNWMFYGSGGYATGYVSTRLVNIATGVEVLGFATSVRQDGWYAGAGFDYMVMKGQVADVILGADYKHVELDSARHCNNLAISCVVLNTNMHDIRPTLDIVTARLTFKFNPWGTAAVVAKY